MSDPCPHCKRFREERDEAIEALEQVRRDEMARVSEDRVHRCASVFRLEPMPARMLLHLTNGRPARRDVLRDVAGSGASTSSNAVDVRLTRIRRALERHGITLRNRNSLGWSIDAADCAKILSMLEEPSP